MIRRVAKALLGPYRIYRVFRFDMRSSVFEESRESPVLAEGVVVGPVQDRAEIVAQAPEDLHSIAVYDQPHAMGFGAWVGSRLAAVCWYWPSTDFYRRKRGFFPLGRRDAELVRIQTASEYVGQNLATLLVECSTRSLKTRGIEVLYARVWHSYRPSRRMFKKAGWKETGLVLEVFPVGTGRTLRLRYSREKSWPRRLSFQWLSAQPT